MMKRVHLIGIGGSGMSSIARVLLEQGCSVSGSDRTLSPLALDLRTRCHSRSRQSTVSPNPFTEERRF